MGFGSRRAGQSSGGSILALHGSETSSKRRGRLRDEAQEALAGYQKQQREAAAEAEAIIAHAKAEAERVAAQAARNLEETLERRRRLAEERIAQEEAKALAEIRAVTVDVAISAARQVIVAELDEQRGAALIDTAIAALPQQLH